MFGLWVKLGLFCYYRRTKTIGVENIPLDKPVLFLSNHQNALMDVLLIATRCKRKPWFLARSDIFANTFLRRFFKFLQMLPIYRLRDGRDQLSKNNRIFHECSELLKNGQAIVVFPEANHSLRRRVRPLSKGFTRIVWTVLEKYPDLDIQLVPVGQNYAYPMQSGDSTVLQFGKALSVQEHLSAANVTQKLRQEVFKSLTNLTTHIPEANYEAMVAQLGENGNIYLDPNKMNEVVSLGVDSRTARESVRGINTLLRGAFVLWNLPMVVLWHVLIKPKVPEEEFMATFRFGFALLVYPIAYIAVLSTFWSLFDAKTACLVVFGHAAFNLLLVKLGITSSYQRR